MSIYSSAEQTRIIDAMTSAETLALQFYELTGKQAAMIEADKMDELNKNLEDRQTVMEKLDEIFRELNNFAKTSEPLDLKIPDDSPGSTQIAALKESILKTLQAAYEINAENEKKALKQMDYYVREGRKVGETRKGINLYNTPGIIQGGDFFDKKQ